MNLAQTFVPQRPLARHCPELTERGPRPEERAQYLATWCRDVASEIAQDMGELLCGAKLNGQIHEPEMVRGQAVFERIGSIAANSLLRCGADDMTVLLSFSIDTAIALTDRSFGGTGEIEPDGPQTLPRSAALLIEQTARTIASAVTRVSANCEEGGDVIIRSENAARLKPFTPSTDCALLRLDLVGSDAVGWTGWIAMPAERLDSLLPGLSTPPANAKSSAAGLWREADRHDEIFGAIPLDTKAVLAEFELSLTQLDRLAPGDQFPIAIAREIPLCIGARLVGTGTLGTMEDRMALKITTVSGGADEDAAPRSPIDPHRQAQREPQSGAPQARQHPQPTKPDQG